MHCNNSLTSMPTIAISDTVSATEEMAITIDNLYSTIPSFSSTSISVKVVISSVEGGAVEVQRLWVEL